MNSSKRSIIRPINEYKKLCVAILCQWAAGCFKACYFYRLWTYSFVHRNSFRAYKVNKTASSKPKQRDASQSSSNLNFFWKIIRLREISPVCKVRGVNTAVYRSLPWYVLETIRNFSLLSRKNATPKLRNTCKQNKFIWLWHACLLFLIPLFERLDDWNREFNS